MGVGSPKRGRRSKARPGKKIASWDMNLSCFPHFSTQIICGFCVPLPGRSSLLKPYNTREEGNASGKHTREASRDLLDKVKRMVFWSHKHRGWIQLPGRYGDRNLRERQHPALPAPRRGAQMLGDTAPPQAKFASTRIKASLSTRSLTVSWAPFITPGAALTSSVTETRPGASGGRQLGGAGRPPHPQTLGRAHLALPAPPWHLPASTRPLTLQGRRWFWTQASGTDSVLRGHSGSARAPTTATWPSQGRCPFLVSLAFGARAHRPVSSKAPV